MTVNIELPPCVPTISLLDIYPGEVKTYTHTQTCTCMFIAELSLIAKKWKLPECPPIDEWLNKQNVAYPHNAIVSIHKQERCTESITWMTLGNIMLRKKKKKPDIKDHIYCMIPLI